MGVCVFVCVWMVVPLELHKRKTRVPPAGDYIMSKSKQEKDV